MVNFHFLPNDVKRYLTSCCEVTGTVVPRTSNGRRWVRLRSLFRPRMKMERPRAGMTGLMSGPTKKLDSLALGIDGHAYTPAVVPTRHPFPLSGALRCDPFEYGQGALVVTA